MRPALRVLISIVLMCLPAAFAVGGGQRSAATAFTDAERAQIDTTVARAVDSGIPESILRARIDEGVAKGAEARQIIQAVEERIRYMEESRNLLDSVDGGQRIRSDQAAWAWTAIMLEAGVPTEEIREIIGVSLDSDRPSDYRNATTAFLEITRTGIPSDQASAITSAMLQSELPSNQFLEVDQLILRAGSDSELRSDIAEIILDQLGQADSLSQLERVVRTYAADRLEPIDRREEDGGQPGSRADDDDDEGRDDSDDTDDEVDDEGRDDSEDDAYDDEDDDWEDDDDD